MNKNQKPILNIPRRKVAAIEKKKFVKGEKPFCNILNGEMNYKSASLMRYNIISATIRP
jgi:hypothetical protein